MICKVTLHDIIIFVVLFISFFLQTRIKMDCSEYLVSELCYPRYAFMKKQVTELMNRGRELQQSRVLKHLSAEDIYLDLVKLSDDKKNMEKIILDVIQSSEARIISSDDIIMRAGTIQKDEIPEEEKMRFQGYFNLRRNRKIALVKLYQYFSGVTYSNRVYVAKDETKRKKRRHRKTDICLKHDFSKEVCRILEVNIFKQLKTTYEELRYLHDKVEKMPNTMSQLFKGKPQSFQRLIRCYV